MKNISPTLPQMEVAADKTKSRSNDRTPSLLGMIGVGFLCLILCGCITEYTPKGIDVISDILVVDGIITDDESYITLSRSVNLTNGDDAWMSTQYVYDAKVCVECDDGSQFFAYFNWSDNRYVIYNGKLDTERQYRLKIEVDQDEYCSDLSYPIQTPEIDSVFWTKRGKGQPVMIYVATHEPRGKVLYYRWSYKEDWEYHADYYLENYPYYCWDKANNRELLLGSAEKTVFGKLTDKVTEISPSSRKISYLYRIDITQNVISKRAYDYFANIKKNSQQIGSIFAPIPSELRGNITCTTDPARPVIGYMDISTTTKKRRFISSTEGAYESPGFNWDCVLVTRDSLLSWYNFIPSHYVLTNPREVELSPTAIPYYIKEMCVECTYYGGTIYKPDDWPNHY